jgi:hypothetical protein
MAMRSGLVRPLAALALGALGGWLGSVAIAQQPPPPAGPAPAPVDATAVAPMTPDGNGGYDGCYVEAEGLLWRRNTTERFVGFILVNPSNSTDPANLQLETRMLHFDFEGGVRITAGYQADGGFGGDVSFMALERSSNSQTINATATDGLVGNIFSPFFSENQPPSINNFVLPFDAATSYQIEASSRLYGGEINAHYTMPTTVGSITLLAGFRYIHLTDNFSLTANGASSPNLETAQPAIGTYDVNCTNNLFGVQVGSEFDANLVPGLRLGLNTKLGFFDNFTRQSQQISNGTFVTSGAPFSGIAGSGEVDRFACVLEFGVFLHWWVIPNVGLSVGYQGMFLTDLALAPKQLSFSFNPAAHNIVDTSGEVFYHGASAGIEIRF